MTGDYMTAAIIEGRNHGTESVRIFGARTKMEEFGMSILNKLMDTMRLTEEDDEDYTSSMTTEDEKPAKKRLL